MWTSRQSEREAAEAVAREGREEIPMKSYIFVWTVQGPDGEVLASFEDYGQAERLAQKQVKDTGGEFTLQKRAIPRHLLTP